MTEEIKTVELEDGTLENVAGGDASNPTGVVEWWNCCKPGLFSPTEEWRNVYPECCYLCTNFVRTDGSNGNCIA